MDKDLTGHSDHVHTGHMTTNTRVNVRDADVQIRAHIPFNYSSRTARPTASLWADRYLSGDGRHVSPGRLPLEWSVQFRNDNPTYIVFSYHTPIAWIASDGRTVIPNVTYSPTTTQHQYTAARGLTGTGRTRSELSA